MLNSRFSAAELEYRTAKFSEVKATDENAGQFTGRASVYGIVDSYNDVVMPGAFTKTLQENNGRIVVLNQHNQDDPIGMADLQDAQDGLHCMGQLELELQSAKDAFIRTKKGLVTGISIGYQTIKEAFAAGGIRQLLEIRLFEISLVTFPANGAARVTGVKRLAQSAMEIESIVSEIKAGRMVSAENLKRLTDALESIAKAGDALKGIIELATKKDDKAMCPECGGELDAEGNCPTCAAKAAEKAAADAAEALQRTEAATKAAETYGEIAALLSELKSTK